MKKILNYEQELIEKYEEAQKRNLIDLLEEAIFTVSLNDIDDYLLLGTLDNWQKEDYNDWKTNYEFNLKMQAEEDSYNDSKESVIK